MYGGGGGGRKRFIERKEYIEIEEEEDKEGEEDKQEAVWVFTFCVFFCISFEVYLLRIRSTPHRSIIYYGR